MTIHIGIDVAKLTLDVAVLLSGITVHRQVSNDESMNPAHRQDVSNANHTTRRALNRGRGICFYKTPHSIRDDSVINIIR